MVATTGTAAEHGSFNYIRQVVPICTPYGGAYDYDYIQPVADWA